MGGRYDAGPAGKVCHFQHELDLLRGDGKWIGKMLEGSISSYLNRFAVHRQSAAGFNTPNQFQASAKGDDAIEFYKWVRLLRPRFA